MIPDKLNIRVPAFSKAAGPAPRRFHVRRVCGGVSRLPGEPPGPRRAGAAVLRGARRWAPSRASLSQPLPAGSASPSRASLSSGPAAPGRTAPRSPRRPSTKTPASIPPPHLFSAGNSACFPTSSTQKMGPSLLLPRSPS